MKINNFRRAENLRFSSIMKKAQASLEYTLIIGMIIFTLTIAVAVAFYYSSQAKGQIRMNQVDKIGKKITDTSDSIYYLGPPSKATIELNMPDQVKSINLSRSDTGSHYIQFTYAGSIGDTIAIYYFKAKISGEDTDQPLNLDKFKSPGLKRLTIEATNNEELTEITFSHSYD